MVKIISMRRDPGDQPPQPQPSSHAKSQGGRPGLPIGPVVEEYLQSAKRHLGGQTYREYRRHLRAFATWADGRKIGLEYINRRAVEEFCEHLFATRQNIRKSGPISKHAVSNYVLVIKVFLHATKRDSIIYGEYLSTDTISAIALPKYDQVLIQPFTDADIKELLKAALAEKTEVLRVRNQTIIYLLSNTGIRVAECATLTTSSLCLEPGMGSVKVMGKGRKERIVMFGELTRRKLERYLEVCRKDALHQDPLFVSYSLSGRGVRRLTTSGIRQMIETVGKRTTIEGVRISPHTLRHYYATRAIEQGMSIVDLKLCLGHESIETTQRYIRSLACDEGLRDRIAAMLR